MAYPAKRVTLWFQDEARVGQKGRLCHRWWLKGQRPPGLCDHRFDWTYIFAAAQPATGDAFALVLPEVSTEAMDLFLAEFSKTLPPDEHALMVVDGAGWHTSKTLANPRQHHTRAPAAILAGTQPGRTHMVVPAGTLPLALRLAGPTRHRPGLLRGLERSRRRNRPDQEPLFPALDQKGHLVGSPVSQPRSHH